MERTVYQKLIEWKGSPIRKPLVLVGIGGIPAYYYSKEVPSSGGGLKAISDLLGQAWSSSLITLS